MRQNRFNCRHATRWDLSHRSDRRSSGAAPGCQCLTHKLLPGPLVGAGAQSFFWSDTALIESRRSNDSSGPVVEALSEVYRRESVSQQRGKYELQGVAAKLEQRFSRGLSFLLSYTRSKLIDEASSVFDASILTGPIANFPVADSFNRRLERDLSNGDIPNVFVASLLTTCLSAKGGVSTRAGSREQS